jgi:uncharacterized protein YndB with AHSA1/START domain
MAESDVGEELTITRIFDAPRELVWRAWTEPELVMRWWGPKGFTSPVSKIDFRVGGKYVSCMRSPEGKEYWGTGVYREIVEPELIICTDSFADEEGNVVSASHYGMSPEFPLEMLLTVRFEEQDGKTKLTLKHVGFPSREDIDGARAGWNESLDKLGEVVEAETGAMGTKVA